ncbi:hypothetical protein OG787_24570 [Streptomyces sp. NBC_00075]|uniref:Uncharacterized protein n=1 Tax=Streptomyces sp. NBC_00093 TaxID=2975649 RepID=A0AAU2A1B8_9ACTN
MAEFKIQKQTAEIINQGENLFIGPQQASAATARIDALLGQIDTECSEADEWTELRAEVESARSALPEREAAVGALERARVVALALRAGSIVAAIATVISSFTQ